MCNFVKKCSIMIWYFINPSRWIFILPDCRKFKAFITHFFEFPDFLFLVKDFHTMNRIHPCLFLKLSHSVLHEPPDHIYVLSMWNYVNIQRFTAFLGLSSRSGKTSYRQTMRSADAARLDAIMIASLWNSTGISAALLSRCLSERSEKSKIEYRGFETSRDLEVRRLTA